MTIPISTSSRTNSTVDKVEMNMGVNEDDELRELLSVNDQQTERIVNRTREVHDLRRRCSENEGIPIDWEDIYQLMEDILKEILVINNFESVFLLEKGFLEGERHRAQSARKKIMDKVRIIQKQSNEWIWRRKEFITMNSKSVDDVAETCVQIENEKIFFQNEIKKIDLDIEFRREREVRILHELAKWKAKRAEENEILQKDNLHEEAMDCLSKFHFMKGLIETELGEIYLKVKEHEKMVKDVADLEEKINHKLFQTDEKVAELKKIQHKCDELKKANNDRRERLDINKKVGDEQLKILEDRITEMIEENRERLEKKVKLLESKDEAVVRAAELVKRKEKAQEAITIIKKRKEMFEMIHNINNDESDDEDLDKTVQQKRELLEKLKAKSKSSLREKIAAKKGPRTY